MSNDGDATDSDDEYIPEQTKIKKVHTVCCY